MNTENDSYSVVLHPRVTYETLEHEIKTDFENSHALALLLAHEVVFINNHWWEKDYSEEQKRLFSINLIVNECFCYGSDAEEVFYDELEDLYNHYEKDPDYGIVVWCAKKRKTLPLPGICKWIKSRGIWNLENII